MIMNKTSTNKIRSATPFLIWFLYSLSPEVQIQMRPYLDQPYQLALNILDCCSSTQLLTVEEISQPAGVTKETARQVLWALKEGGMPLAVCSPQKWQLVKSEPLPVDNLTGPSANGKMPQSIASSIASDKSINSPSTDTQPYSPFVASL
jgi:hypothetical protein